LNGIFKDFQKDFCKRDDFLREVISAIQLRCTARPHLRVRHERRAMTGVAAVENDGLGNGNRERLSECNG
jgi:hypothetical protein